MFTNYYVAHTAVVLAAATKTPWSPPRRGCPTQSPFTQRTSCGDFVVLRELVKAGYNFLLVITC